MASPLSVSARSPGLLRHLTRAARSRSVSEVPLHNLGRFPTFLIIVLVNTPTAIRLASHCLSHLLTQSSRIMSIPFGTDVWVPLDPSHAILGNVADEGRGLVSKTVGGTDWWRTTERHSTNGPTLGFWREVGTGFEVSVDIEIEPRVQ